MNPFRRLLLTSLLAASLPLAVRGAEPEMKMHRVQATTKDVSGSGWYYAASTEGSFSVNLPIPFNDFTATVQDSKLGVTKAYIIGSKSGEGLKFSVTETPKTATTKEPDMDSFATGTQRAGSTLKNVNRAPYQGMPSVVFEVSDPKAGAYVRYVNTPHSLFILILEYPAERRQMAAELQERFLGSLVFKQPQAATPAPAR